MSNISQTKAALPAVTKLTGTWSAWPVPLDADLANAVAPPDARAVPDSTHLQPALYPDNRYWGNHLRQLNESGWAFEQRFDVPGADFARARLRFEGVDYFAAVWLNGAFLGEHEGHFAPFEFDVTDVLRAEDNVLAVIFFRDPLTAQPHEPDVSALMRICDVHNVPLATNLAAAEAALEWLRQHPEAARLPTESDPAP